MADEVQKAELGLATRRGLMPKAVAVAVPSCFPGVDNLRLGLDPAPPSPLLHHLRGPSALECHQIGHWTAWCSCVELTTRRRMLHRVDEPNDNAGSA